MGDLGSFCLNSYFAMFSMMLISCNSRVLAAGPGIMFILTAGRRGDRCEANYVYALLKEKKISTKTVQACFIDQSCVT